jgi:putative transposase
MTWAGRLDKIMATRKRHSPEQIVRELMAADRLLALHPDGRTLPCYC